MRHQTIVGHKQKLDALFEKTNALDHDAELVAHWSRYLCVLVSGFVEASTRTLILDYARRRSAPEITSFVRQRTRKFTNAKMSKIIELVGEFSDLHKKRLSAFSEGEVKASVDSIVSNRHLIAHGQDVGIGIASVRKYYQAAIRAIEEIESMLSA